MLIFSLVFYKILTSLLYVLIGFLAGKYANIDRDSIAKLLFYFVAPVVFFAIPTNATLSLGDLSLIVVVYAICGLLVVFSYWLYGYIWQDANRNILALSAGTGNGAYVVLPIATALFDDKTLSIFAIAMIGIAICEASIGLYFCLRGEVTKKDSIIKVLKLPILNAFFMGCLFSLSGFQMPDFLNDFIINMKASFAMLGMLLIGIGLSHVKGFKIDWKFTAAAFASKFIYFPAAFNLFIFLDFYIFGWYDYRYYNAIQLATLAPMATNTIVISSLYKMHPEKVATSVLLSLLFVLIYMPVMASLLLSDISI